MEVVVHRLPTKPTYSCFVLVFHKNRFGEIYHVANVEYSAKYGLFNCHDWSLADEVDTEYGDDICAWCYMSDVETALLSDLAKMKEYGGIGNV